MARQISNPTQPRSLAQFHRTEYRPIKADKDRNLQQHRQTAAQRIDFFAAVHLHHSLLHRHTVIAVLLFQCLELRCDRTHFRHGFIGGVVQREENYFDDNGQQDDCPAPVAGKAVQFVHQPEEAGCRPMYAAVVFNQFQMVGDFAECGSGLRTGVQGNTEALLHAVSQLGLRNDDAGGIKVVAAAFDVDAASIGGTHALSAFRLQNPRREEVVLAHTDPAGLRFTLVFGLLAPFFEVVIQIAECDFLEFALRGVQHWPRVVGHEIALAFRRFAVADDAVGTVSSDGAAAAVGHVKTDADQIAAFGKSIDFVDLDAVGSIGGQADFGFVAFKAVLLLRTLKTQSLCQAAAGRIHHVGLGDINAVLAIVKQCERFALIFCRIVFQQGQAAQITAFFINNCIDGIRADRNRNSRTQTGFGRNSRGGLLLSGLLHG